MMKVFCRYLWDGYSNWKSVAHSIYHLEHLIKHLENYQIKNVLEKQFRTLSDYFISFIKDLITDEIQSEKRKLDVSVEDPVNPSEINGIERLKTHLNSLKESVLTMKERFNLCKADLDAIGVIVQAIDEINFDGKTFDRSDLEKIHLLSVKEDLAQKSNKTDLIQMKNYIDQQIKNLIELNQENARELERIKLFKTSTCEARQIQSILTTNPSSSPSKQVHSRQSSRPYITFELDQIRKYQRQALIQSPYGTIPLYRRQAWAAANLFPNQSLHFLRYLQSSLRMQVHDLLGSAPSDICHTTKRKKSSRTTPREIFHQDKDVLIMGNNKKLYRGRIDSCELMPLKKGGEKKVKTKTNSEEKHHVQFEEFDQSNQKVFDEHLFEYLDWQIQFNEQDLLDELCAELFNHWRSIVCNDDQPCQCDSPTRSEPIDMQSEPSSSSIATIYDDRCMCSECSCSCDKYSDDQSICLCPQCSCQCLKEWPPEDQSEIIDETIENEFNTEEKEEEEGVPAPPTDQTAAIEETEIMPCNCFLNQSPGPFPSSLENPSHSSKTLAAQSILHSLELDDPSQYRHQILHHHSLENKFLFH